MRTSRDIGCFPAEFVRKIEGFYPTMANIKAESEIYDYETLLTIMGYSIDTKKIPENTFDDRYIWRRWHIPEREEINIAFDCGKNIEDISEIDFKSNILSAVYDPVSRPKLSAIWQQNKALKNSNFT